MDAIARHQRLLDHDQWANREVARALRVMRAPVPEALTTLAHIVGSEWLWLARLRSERSAVSVWPAISLDECEGAISELSLAWRDLLTAWTSNSLAASIEYTNSRGEAWSSCVEDVLTHVVMHSHYHRGQIASAMRRAGEAPAHTDFIHAVRQGHVGGP